MADPDDAAPFTTWDGEPVSREPPHGATIVVAAQAPQGWRYLLLHRAHHGPAWDGDWAWTPPSGSRKPGEDVIACAIRELHEDGLRGSLHPVVTSDANWAVFALEVPWGTPSRGGWDGTRPARLGHLQRSSASVPTPGAGGVVRHSV